MALYAHARIEDPADPGRVWERGDEVSPEDAEALALDREFGAVSAEPYDPEADKNAPPDVIEIDGVRYTKAPAEPEEEPDA